MGSPTMQGVIGMGVPVVSGQVGVRCVVSVGESLN